MGKGATTTRRKERGNDTLFATTSRPARRTPISWRRDRRRRLGGAWRKRIRRRNGTRRRKGGRDRRRQVTLASLGRGRNGGRSWASALRPSSATGILASLLVATAHLRRTSANGDRRYWTARRRRRLDIRKRRQRGTGWRGRWPPWARRK